MERMEKQFIARLNKWEGRFPQARLLFFGWEPGRDFFMLANGECALYSDNQLQMLKRFMKTVFKSKEERDQLLEAFDEARDKAKLIKQATVHRAVHHRSTVDPLAFEPH